MLTGPGIANLLLLGASLTSAAASSERDVPQRLPPGPYDTHWVSLPTDRETQAEVNLVEVDPPTDFSRLMRPRFGLSAEWEARTSGVEIGNYDVNVRVPTYPLYGPPPPMISAGFSYTDLIASAELDLPPSLYDFTLGASWMRPFNERWMLRFMASAAFASDLNNTSSDAWQFRGGVFATYRWHPNLQLLVGVFASGRDDLPVLPGVGAIWTPTPDWHLNLMMPRPRIAYRVANLGAREHWIFVGGGLSGGTWAFQADTVNDRLTYRQWRAGIGWEYGPTKTFPPRPGGGPKFEFEVGYIFGREFEFETRTPEISLNDTLLLRTGVNF